MVPEILTGCPIILGLVSFDLVENNEEMTGKLCEYLKQKNYFVFPSKLNGAAFIRVAFGGVMTTEVHAEALWNEILGFLEGGRQ